MVRSNLKKKKKIAWNSSSWSSSSILIATFNKTYNGVLKPYSGVFMQFFCFYKFDRPIPGSGGPIVAFSKTYCGILQPYNGVFMQFFVFISLIAPY